MKEIEKYSGRVRSDQRASQSDGFDQFDRRRRTYSEDIEVYRTSRQADVSNFSVKGSMLEEYDRRAALDRIESREVSGRGFDDRYDDRLDEAYRRRAAVVARGPVHYN